MYIEPNTNIRLLHNVPLDNTYQHTIWFTGATNQYNYFIGKQKYNLTKYSYQRVQRGRARVGIVADNLYDCNYMMFQNTNFGSKWFYAFIKSVEYINNVTSEIEFEIDVMQTWFFDYDTEYCFVEREHVSDDTIGAHIEAEPVALGEYVMNDYSPVEYMNDMAVIIAIVDTNDESDGTLYDGVYGSASLWAYDSTDVSSINEKVNEYVQQTEAIIGMYMIPKLLLGNSIPSTHKLSYGASGTATTVSKTACSTSMKLDGYTPRNNKLYTYPYNFYHVDNANGSSLALRYEFFDNLTPVLRITGTVTEPCEVVLRPCSYKGVSSYSELGGYTTLNTESLTLKGYPLCSWNYDAYQAWVAQNSIPLALNTIANVGEMAVGATYGNASGAAVGAGLIGQTANVVSQMYKASIASDISKGSFNNGGANVADHKQQFYGGQCSINAKQARIIDDFFDMYGYAVRVVKKPARGTRPHWNYVKTVGCCLTGSVPADDMRKLCSIYDNGVTFWKNGDEVGNYGLDNSPS